MRNVVQGGLEWLTFLILRNKQTEVIRMFAVKPEPLAIFRAFTVSSCMMLHVVIVTFWPKNETSGPKLLDPAAGRRFHLKNLLT